MQSRIMASQKDVNTKLIICHQLGFKPYWNDVELGQELYTTGNDLKYIKKVIHELIKHYQTCKQKYILGDESQTLKKSVSDLNTTVSEIIDQIDNVIAYNHEEEFIGMMNGKPIYGNQHYVHDGDDEIMMKEEMDHDEDDENINDT